MSLARKLLVSSGAALPVEVVATDINTSSAASYSFTGVSLGDAAAGSDTRTTMVCVYGNINTGTRQVSGVTIGGNAMTLYARTAASLCPCAIYRYDSTALGTTATIAPSFSGGNSNHCYIVVYRVKNFNASVTTIVDDVHSSGLLSLNMSISDTDYGIGAASARNGTSESWTWTGASEDIDYQHSAFATHTSATISNLSGSPATINVQYTDTTPTDANGVAVAFSVT